MMFDPEGIHVLLVTLLVNSGVRYLSSGLIPKSVRIDVGLIGDGQECRIGFQD